MSAIHVQILVYLCNMDKVCVYVCVAAEGGPFPSKKCKIKINQSRYRPGVAQRVPGS